MLLLSSNSNKDVLFIFSVNKVAAEEEVGTSGTESCEGCLQTQFKHLPPQLALKLGLVKPDFHSHLSLIAVAIFR